MLLLGKKQNLKVVKEVAFGVYLSEEGGEEKVLLPKKQVPEGTKPGDVLLVFLYRDSQDRLIASTHEPLVMLGETAVLEVKETGKIGAFLDWGLEKDLLLPFREMTGKVQPGDRILAALYLDKSSRLCATMKVYHYLKKNSPYKKEDTVQGIVYEVSDNFGVFVAVDGKYSALLPKREAYGSYKPGERVTARVSEVKEDGKLTLSVRKKAYLQMDEDAVSVMKAIEGGGGALPFNDKADPELIKKKLCMSKNAFKRAVGRLLKAGKIEITDKEIRIKA